MILRQLLPLRITHKPRQMQIRRECNRADTVMLIKKLRFAVGYVAKEAAVGR